MDSKCYFCGNTIDSREHIPAKCFFQDNMCYNLITVPSCKKHNSQKSELDSYTRDIITMHRTINTEGLNKFKKKSIRSLTRRKINKSIITISKPIIINGQESLGITFDKIKFDEYFKYLSSGLYYHLYNKVFLSDWFIYQYSLSEDNTNNYSIPQDIIDLIKTLNDSNEFIDINSFENKTIFKVAYLEKDDGIRKIIIFKTIFYEGFLTYSFGEFMNNEKLSKLDICS